MTAEVVVLNRNGVALAADSAVTVRTDSRSKVYNTVNKLFTLSKFQPVGIMVYGNADYMGVPWETVIKLYRDKLGKRQFKTIKEYARDFLRFVDRDMKVSRTQESEKVFQVWSSYFEELNRTLRTLLIKSGESKTLKKEDVVSFFSFVVGAEISRLKKLKNARGLEVLTRARVRSRFGPEFTSAKSQALKGRPFTKELDRRLFEYAYLILVKAESRLGASGIVASGFGTNEMFPCLYSVNCCGKYLGKLKLIQEQHESIGTSLEERVFVRAYAQGEMVYRFMEGIDQSYSDYLKVSFSEILRLFGEELINKLSALPKKKKEEAIASIKVVVGNLVEDFDRRSKSVRYEKFVRPVLDVVAVLPKDELAELAGALVNITSLKRKISMDADSVGGPIDVAVISKGDGFVWIRRKHYFRPELNPFFLQKYLSP